MRHKRVCLAIYPYLSLLPLLEPGLLHLKVHPLDVPTLAQDLNAAHAALKVEHQLLALPHGERDRHNNSCTCTPFPFSHHHYLAQTWGDVLNCCSLFSWGRCSDKCTMSTHRWNPAAHTQYISPYLTTYVDGTLQHTHNISHCTSQHLILIHTIHTCSTQIIIIADVCTYSLSMT